MMINNLQNLASLTHTPSTPGLLGFMTRRRVSEAADGDQLPVKNPMLLRQKGQHFPDLLFGSGKNIGLCVVCTLMLIALMILLAKFSVMNTFRDLNVVERMKMIEYAEDDDDDEIEVEEISFPSIDMYFEITSYDIWIQPNRDLLYKCAKRSTEDIKGPSNGYILVNLNGGLSQIKTEISDMVAIAKLMNATLVLPPPNHSSYRIDTSEFKDIFDCDHFMKYLDKDIWVVDQLPPEFASIQAHQQAPLSYSKASYYRDDLVSLLRKQKVIEFTHTNSRLANNGLPTSILKLRCRAMYEALKFTEQIETLARKMINRLREHSKPYIALHLGYEKDILAFTGCSHNLTQAEANELRKMKYSLPEWKEEEVDGDERRRQGLCPMTPREIAVFLEAMGYPTNTNIYIGSGKIYGQRGIRDLKDKYRNILTHSSLATEEELKPFSDQQNQLAAVDYTVALESDVFVYTLDGNMAEAVQGHRKYEGFRKTISPDKLNFVELYDQMDKELITWDDFSSKVRLLHANSTGGPDPRKPGSSIEVEESFYANPYPGCIC